MSVANVEFKNKEHKQRAIASDKIILVLPQENNIVLSANILVLLTNRTFNISYYQQNNRTSYLNFRTANYRTLNCFRTLHLHSRTLCKSYYWYRTTSDSSQPWSEVKTFMQSKRNKASPMPDVVLCKHDSYNLTETFSHTQSCQHEEKYDHRGT